MAKCKLAPKDFARAVFYGPDGKNHAGLAKRLGFDTQTQVQDLLFHSVGNTGAATLPIMLTHALCETRPGDRILVANYGDGGDALVLQVTGEVEKVQRKQKLKERLARKIYVDYEKYLSWRDLMPLEEARRPESRPASITCLWRERKSVLSLYGGKCKRCGTVQYPAQRICANCQSKDDYEDYKLSDKEGKIFTYAIDYLTASKEVPAVVGVVDFEGGGRIMCEIVDCEPSKVEIGMPVEMCLRKRSQRGTIPNYLWRARPIL